MVTDRENKISAIDAAIAAIQAARFAVKQASPRATDYVGAYAFTVAYTDHQERIARLSEIETDLAELAMHNAATL